MQKQVDELAATVISLKDENTLQKILILALIEIQIPESRSKIIGVLEKLREASAAANNTDSMRFLEAYLSDLKREKKSPSLQMLEGGLSEDDE